MTSTTTELDLLDHPVAALEHADAYVRAAMQWHFGRHTGSRFWLDAADELPFDPLHDITGVADLARFPDLTDRLRTTSMADLIPQGYALSNLVGVFESGGTTGAPKRVLLDRTWLHAMTERNNATVAAHGFESGRDWLGVLPSGPHLVGEFFRDSVRTYGRLGFTVDLDPRWVRGRIAAGDRSAADSYAEHVVDQAEDILRTQDIGVLVTTPALLERFAARAELVSIMNDRLSGIRWGGTHLDADSLDVYREEVFPEVSICGNYGSTTFVGFNGQRAGSGGAPVFDSPAAGLVLSVVDEDLRPVAFGERGRVLAHHLSRAMLIPSNLERDTALRVESEHGVGDAVSDVGPIGAVGDVEVVEGVY